MIPSTAVGLLLAVAAISPGYVYVRYASTRRPRADRSTLTETAEYLVWGVTAVGLAALFVFGAAELGLPVFVELKDLTDPAISPFQAHPWQTVCSAVVIYVLALLLALLAARRLHRGETPSVVEEPVWWTVFGQRSEDEEVFCSVSLASGRVVEGFLFSYTTGDSEPRDIALKPPLWFWHADTRYSVSGVDRVILPASQIVEVDARVVTVVGAAT